MAHLQALKMLLLALILLTLILTPKRKWNGLRQYSKRILT